MNAGLVRVDVTPLPKFQVYPVTDPGDMVVKLVNWVTVLIQLDGGLKAITGVGAIVTIRIRESAQPRLDMALSFTE